MDSKESTIATKVWLPHQNLTQPQVKILTQEQVGLFNRDQEFSNDLFEQLTTQTTTPDESEFSRCFIWNTKDNEAEHSILVSTVNLIMKQLMLN